MNTWFFLTLPSLFFGVWLFSLPFVILESLYWRCKFQDDCQKISLLIILCSEEFSPLSILWSYIGISISALAWWQTTKACASISLQFIEICQPNTKYISHIYEIIYFLCWKAYHKNNTCFMDLVVLWHKGKSGQILSFQGY